MEKEKISSFFKDLDIKYKDQIKEIFYSKSYIKYSNYYKI